MANYNQLNTIGSGPYFPIRLEYKRDKDGNIISDSIVVDPGTPDIPGKPEREETITGLVSGVAKLFYERFGETTINSSLSLTDSNGLVYVLEASGRSKAHIALDEGNPVIVLEVYQLEEEENSSATLSVSNFISVPEITSSEGDIRLDLYVNARGDLGESYGNQRLNFGFGPDYSYDDPDLSYRKCHYKSSFNLHEDPGSENYELYLTGSSDIILGEPQKIFIRDLYTEYTVTYPAEPAIPGKPPVIEYKALVGWYPLYGDIRLIKQNITAILTYQIGQRFRQEDFGSRTWECLEEPNVSALNLMIKNFVKDGIAAWEPRIKALKVLALKPTKESIRLLIYFRVQNSQRVEELNFQYNLNNSTTNVY
jgi:phage baseplate assembly protein W